MKRFVFVLSLLCLGFGMERVEAQPANTCVPPEAPKSECAADAECEKDGDSCTAPKCNLAIMDWKCAPGTTMADGKTGVSWTVGKCAVPEAPVANCQPDCGALFPGNPDAQSCCKDFGLTDPAENKCCVEHVTHGEKVKHPITGKLIPCDKDCPKCRPCLPPKIDCDLIGDPKIKACCEVKGGLLWFVMDSCIPHGPGGKEGCENIAKNIDNSGVFQQCCFINNGVINGDINMCNNLTGGGPGGSTTGGTPTIPEGSAALTCSVAQVGAPVEGKFAITYTVPDSAVPVVSATLTQVSGSQIKVDGESEPADFGNVVTTPKSMSTKTISDPNNPPSFTVYAPTPKSMIGEWKAPFEVKVSLAALGGEAGSALCTEDHLLHSEGGCSCSMTATLTTREQFMAYAMMAAFLSLPLLLFRMVRARAGKKESYMSKQIGSVPVRFLIAAVFVLFAASVGHAAPTPAVEQVYRVPSEAIARPLDNIGDYVPIPDCKTDADCKDPDPDDCKEMKCVPYKSLIPAAGEEPVTLGKCQSLEKPNCPPPAKNCSDLFTDPTAQKCCEKGVTDPAENKCCVEHVTHGEDPFTADGKLIPCNGKDCPKCDRCPPPPTIDCNLIGDPKMKSCCVEKGGLLFFVMDSCIPDGPGGEAGCTNLAEHITNSGVFQQCCFINNGVINGDINMCNNTFIPGEPGSGTGGTPTVPEGSASALTCSVAQVGTPVEGKFAITYRVPGSEGPVVSATLTQISGSQIKVEGEAEPSDFGSTVTSPKAMSTKTISDPNNPPSFTVFAPTPKSMTGEWKAPFEVKVSLATLDGDAGSALCTEEHSLHAEGGCACSMTASLTPREQIAAYAVIAFLLMVPLAALRTARKIEKK